jgi:hypothetical protein
MPQSERTNYRTGMVELRDCLLFNYRKAAIDIRHLMIEFNVYHDLFANGVTCEIVLADSNGLIEFLPIVGDEIFVISFVTPTLDETLTYVFQVYNISDRSKSNGRSESYVLRGVSQELISNSRKSVNISYKDIPVSSIVKGIYNSYLKPSEEDFGIIKAKKEINVEETLDNFHVVFSGEKPFECIRYLSKEAQSLNSDNSLASNFIFFEKNDGWYFKTIDSMLSAEAVDNFYFTEASGEIDNNDAIAGDDDDGIVYKYQMINNLEFINQFNTLERLNNGYYSHTIETIDPILKKFTKDLFLYEKDFNKIAHIENSKKTFGTNYVYSENSIFSKEAGSSIKKFIISNIGENYNKLEYLSKAFSRDPQIRNPRKLHKFMKYDLVSRLQLDNIVLSVGIPGNSQLEIGDIVNLHIPQSTGNKDFLNELNLLYDKRFFITSIRHTYNKVDNNFFTVFECVKDTYAKKVIEVT